MKKRNSNELQAVFRELKDAVRRLQLKPASEHDQCEVCLASRSAFTLFHSLSVLQNEVDEWAEANLRRLLESAVGSLKPGKYRDSVQHRIDEFDAFCKDILERAPLDTGLF